VIGLGNSGGEILLDLIEHGGKPSVAVRSALCVVPRSVVRILESLVHSHGFLFAWIPFLRLSLPLIVIVIDLTVKMIGRIRWGRIEKYNLRVRWLGPIANMLMTFQPPFMDVGTLDLIVDGTIKVFDSEIEKFEKEENRIRFKDGKVESFDCVVLATGFEIIAGHSGILEQKIVEKVGTGVKAIKDRKLWPGREAKGCKRLWFIWGRLQQINDGAPPMANAIAKKIGKKGNALTNVFRKMLIRDVLLVFCLIGYFFILA